MDKVLPSKKDRANSRATSARLDQCMEGGEIVRLLVEVD